MRPKRLTAKLTIACDPIWLAAVEEQARRCGLSRTEFVRRAVSETKILERPDRGYHDLAVQLAKLGTLYNQTVRLAHQTRHKVGSIPADALLRELSAHRATLARILESLTADGPTAKSARRRR